MRSVAPMGSWVGRQLVSALTPPQTHERHPQIFISFPINGSWCGLSQGWIFVLIFYMYRTCSLCEVPFRAKHHVVVQYVARWMKCPLPPPQPPSRRQGGQGESATLPMRQGTSHCSCLEHCFLLLFFNTAVRPKRKPESGLG